MIKEIGVGIALIGSIVSGFVFVDSRHASHNELMQLAGVVNKRFLNDDYRILRQRIWDYEKNYNYKVDSMPPHVRKEYENLKIELEKIKIEMQKKK